MMKPEFKWFDPSLEFKKRIDLLRKEMTVEEKISQLLHQSPAIPRLGIPSCNWWNEALHGVARAGRATVFPQAVGLACTFDAPLVKKMARAIAMEGRAKRHAAKRTGNEGGIYFGLTYWTPNINIFRDPRWGRGQETYGEDPHLTGELGKAMVEGLQGNDPKYLLSAACAKHFWGHSGPESLRHHFNARISPYDAATTYLPAFEKLVREARVEGVMGAYNRTNGEVCCGSAKYIRRLLRDEWGFQGYFVSDCGAIDDFPERHKVAKNLTAAAALALKNGCDVNCGCSYEKLLDAFRLGMISMEHIDEALGHALMTRMKLGLFDPDGKVPFAQTPERVIGCPAHRRIARKLAAESVVLLENNGILPLRKDAAKYGITGPNAAAFNALWGNYNGFSSHFVTPFEGVLNRISPGTYLAFSEDPRMLDLGAVHTENPVTVLYVAGYNETLEGEEGNGDADRSSLGLPEPQRKELDALYAREGVKVVLIVIAGSPVDLSADREKAAAILFVPYPGEEGGNALADVLFGDISPSGRLPVTFPASMDDLPPFEDYSMRNRTYRFLEKPPLYPFGYGLSYTRFNYSGLRTAVSKSGVLISFRLRNEGPVDGAEVVQVYLRWKTCGNAHVPNCELVTFLRLDLKKGAKIDVRMKIPMEKLLLTDESGRKSFQPGAEFELFVGGSSSLNAPLSAKIQLQTI